MSEEFSFFLSQITSKSQHSIYKFKEKMKIVHQYKQTKFKN